jgi:16S rRNA (guanine966-N2)-methyltransferase
VLDLFAGTGALGIEALSRGAAGALFVDSSPAAVRAVLENLQRTKLAALAEVRRQEALAGLRSGIGPFELVFLDPPYRLPQAALERVIGELAGQSAAVPGALVVLTRSNRSYTPVIPVNWQLLRRLSYGDAVVFVIQTS